MKLDETCTTNYYRYSSSSVLSEGQEAKAKHLNVELYLLPFVSKKHKKKTAKKANTLNRTDVPEIIVVKYLKKVET